MKTETTPITNWIKTSLMALPYGKITIQEQRDFYVNLSEDLERSRRRNIRRAWKLRKLNIQRRDDRCAMVRTMAAMNHQLEEAIQECAEVAHQRDEAIQIAEEAMGGGHRGHRCTALLEQVNSSCDCGYWRGTLKLDKLTQEIK